MAAHYRSEIPGAGSSAISALPYFGLRHAFASAPKAAKSAANPNDSAGAETSNGGSISAEPDESEDVAGASVSGNGAANGSGGNGGSDGSGGNGGADGSDGGNGGSNESDGNDTNDSDDTGSGSDDDTNAENPVKGDEAVSNEGIGANTADVVSDVENVAIVKAPISEKDGVSTIVETAGSDSNSPDEVAGNVSFENTNVPTGTAENTNVPTGTAGSAGNGNGTSTGGSADVPSNGKRTKRIVLRVLLGLVALLALVYIAGAVFFSSHFIVNTKVGGIDASWLSVDEVAAKATESAASYTDTIEGQGFTLELSAADLGLTVDSDAFARDAFATQNAFAWPATAFEGAALNPTMAAHVNEEQTRAKVNEAVSAFNANVKAPTSATVAYDSGENTFKITPESLGEQLDAGAVATRAINDATLLRTGTKLTEAELLRPPFLQDDTALASARDKANTLLANKFNLTFNGEKIYDIDSKLINQWIEILYDDNSAAEASAAAAEAAAAAAEEGEEDEEDDGEEYGYYFYDSEQGDFIFVPYYDYDDEETVDPWDQPDPDVGYEFDNGKGHKVAVRISQKAIRWWSYITLNNIVNGEDETRAWEVNSWETAGVMKAAINEGKKDDVEVVTITTNERPPETEGHEARGRHIDVNLSTQYARFYDTDGKTVIWRSFFVSGIPDGKHNTPTGEFAIRTKEYDIVMIGPDEDHDGEPDYRTPCTYYMAFTATEGFHDAYWRTYYGSDIYTWYGSHGCVNLSYEKAEELWNLVEIGDPVYVHY